MYLQLLLHRSSNATDEVHNSASTSEGSTPKQCILCGSKDKRMTQYGNWGSKEQKFLLLHLDSPPTDSSSIYVSLTS